MNIFSIKNEEISYFNRPMFFESDAECKAYILNVLTSDADRALINLRDKLSLYCLGTIDFGSGNIETPFEPVLICSLDSIFDLVPNRSQLDTHKALRELAELKSDLKQLADDVDRRLIAAADEISHCKKRR